MCMGDDAVVVLQFLCPLTVPLAPQKKLMSPADQPQGRETQGPCICLLQGSADQSPLAIFFATNFRALTRGHHEEGNNPQELFLLRHCPQLTKSKP